MAVKMVLQIKGRIYTEVLMKISGPTRLEVGEERRILHIEEIHNLYCLSDITGVIKFQRMVSVSNEDGRGEEKGIEGFGGTTLGKQTAWKT
jgi:hypothetical protein